MIEAKLENVGSMDVVLTASCNLNCSYCYQNTKTKARMTWETLQGSIDLLLQSSKPSVNLTFYGGEPLLQFDLIRRAVDYCKSLPDPKPRIEYSMISNGTLLDPEVAEFLARNEFKTRISFDGVPAAQIERGAGTHARLDALLDRFRREHPRYFRERVEIGMVLMSTTIRYLPESIEYMLGKRVQTMHLSPLDTHDAGWTAESTALLDQAFERIHAISLRHYENTGEVPLALFKRNRADAERPAWRSMCGVGRGEQLTVDVEGDISGCLVFAGSYQSYPSDFLDSRVDPLRLGRIGESGFSARLALYPAAVRAAKIFHDKQDKYSSFATCGECRFMDTCSICPISIGYIPGNTDPNRVPDHLCAYNLVTRKWRERFPVQPGPLAGLLGRAPLPASMQRLRERATTPARPRTTR